MNILNNLKLDSWWSIVLYIGVILAVSSLTVKIDFLEERHLFGIAIGMILVGIAYVVAVEERSAFKPPNAYTGGAALLTWREVHHNVCTVSLLILGVFIIAIFGFKLISSLL